MIIGPLTSTISPFEITAKAASAPVVISAQAYNLDITGATDTSTQFQAMTDSFPSSTTLVLPKGTYKFASTVNLKAGINLQASNDVTIIGTGSNTLINTSSNTGFSGIGFQYCNTAIRINQQTGITIYWCNFKNYISYSAIDIYNGSNISISSCFLWQIQKYGVLINGDSSDISIAWNNFSNPSVFGGYKTEQIGGQVYCLSGTRITVNNNTLSNSGGQGAIFGYNSTTGEGTTNSIAEYNTCIGNGQEGITSYGGSDKITSGNSIIGNTWENNRFNQIEIWQSDNNTVTGNTVDESTPGVGNLGAICLFNTTNTTCTSNKILSSQSNGITIVAGTMNCTVSSNIITNTNRMNDTSHAEKGNGILLDWNGVADPQYIIITNNTINSSDGIINKSGVYSTSNTNHHNTINSNTITNYEYGVHPYAMATCGA